MFTRNAIQMQVIWFLAAPELPDAAKIYTLVANVEPETVQRNKILSPMSPFLSYASGRMDLCDIDVRVQPGRVDLTFNAIVEQDSYLRSGLSIFNIDSVISEYAPRIISASNSVGQTFRLSFIVNLAERFDNPDLAAQRFGEMTGYPEEKLAGAVDFIFQINRPSIKSATPFNRIVRINTAKIQTISINANFMQPAMIQQNQVNLTDVVVTTFDFNTIPNNIILGSSECTVALEALKSEVVRFISAGHLDALKEEPNA